MDGIAAARMDVTRNERGEVLVSLALPRATAMADPALLLRREGVAWRAAIRDRADPSAPALRLPDVPPLAARWLAEAEPFRRPFDPVRAIPGDRRVEGQRYALVCEVVDGSPANGYFARLAPLPPGVSGTGPKPPSPVSEKWPSNAMPERSGRSSAS